MKGKIKVGVACVVVNEQKEILLGIRISKNNGNGLWQLCGGHHEFGESLVQTALRETKEETNLDLKDISFITFTEHTYKQKQYITFVYIGKASGALINLEPHKCEGWSWHGIDELPSPLFEIDEKTLELIKESVERM